jgi:excinuclease ABC subunit B
MLSEKDLAKRRRQLEDQMYKAARDLEFEEAARLRDELKALDAAVIRSGEV